MGRAGRPACRAGGTVSGRSRCLEGEEKLGAWEARDRCPGRGIRSGVKRWGPASRFRARMDGWEGPPWPLQILHTL